MAFQGGKIDVLGVNPSFLTGLATVATSGNIPQAIGQIWQGSGQSFYGQAGQALAGNLASSAVNIALNGALGTQVVGPQGLSLTSGANLLASTVTPYVTSSLAAGINQSIQQSLQSAGPFGNLLSDVGTGIVNQLAQGLGVPLGGSNATNYKMFPGGGGEAKSDYGGNAYTLDDVVFSLQPANQGPQAFGLSESLNFPKSLTTLPFTELSKMSLTAGSATANTLKQSAMVGGIKKVSFTPAAFTSGSIL